MITAVPKDQNPAMPMPECKKGQRRLRPERGKICRVNSGSDILVIFLQFTDINNEIKSTLLGGEERQKLGE